MMPKLCIISDESYKGNGIFQFSAILLQFYAYLPQNVVVRNLCRLKYLIGQTRHGAVHTAFFNIRWRRKIIQKIIFSNFPWFFTNFRTFYPKMWLSATPNELHFWYIYKALNSTWCINYASFRKTIIKGMGFFNFPRFLHKNGIFALKITNFHTSDFQRKWPSEQQWYEEWFTTKIISVAISSRYGRILM